MKSEFYRWFDPEGYHTIKVESTKEYDDTPGNEFIFKFYYKGTLLGENKFQAEEGAIFPRMVAEKKAIAWFESELKPKINYLELVP